ncbi:RagB/SusD family nutrient uptake outer membrane protein [Aquimarina gracilis]|uniref:RagB/SusD family nutrient uptake outer membrane protein n=1 Tax=Aquimarina gracilis TaxID=874422 RepID=A0ABU5ZXE1_9FLAO|nr:RagB/SusD family nutrient uptake outer membrane protein [Aquimarina gracilis]MEB3346570.1 RagB/SusD family nutrient uptake outer membrane protein [Aquimarina gracilis]
MKNKIMYILWSVTFILSSCDDTLEQQFSDNVEVSDAIVDLNSLNLAVNGSYSLFADTDLYNRTLMLLPEILSDNAFIDAFDNTGRYLDFDSYTVNDNNRFITPTWEDLTRIIASTSIIIRNAEALSFPESEQEDAEQYIGEMYALRALAFHNLQLLFAQPYNFTADASHLGVPIPDFETLGDGGTIQEPGRSTTAQVYEQIESDLLSAIDLMRSESSPNRMDVHAARALLARVYLHMENWTGARDNATKVIDDSGNSLLENQEYSASWALDSNRETLFTLVNNETDNSGTNSIGYFYLTYEDAFATEDFVNTLSDSDVRKELYPRDGDVNLVRKFPRVQVQDDNIQVLRLSEMYLIKAEAHAQLTEDVQAQDALDAIRLRADPGATASTETGQALIDKIILERRKELAYEGFRLYDLTRYGITFNKFQQDGDPIPISAPENLTIMPIPIDEINVNPNIANQQNPGY